eukprot:scaffold77527_cov20-Tisochrysis_lutea.AAC.1
MGISKPRFHDVHTLSVESLRALGVALPVLTGKIIKYVSELMTRRQPIRTTERSVASDAEKLVAPVLPGTEVALQCLGQEQTFLQTMPHPSMHA